jgi:hypothetical protein
MSSAVLAIFRYLLFATSFIQPEVARDQLTLSQIVNSGNIDPKTLSISIDKSDYQLAILSGEKAIKNVSGRFRGQSYG